MAGASSADGELSRPGGENSPPLARGTSASGAGAETFGAWFTRETQRCFPGEGTKALARRFDVDPRKIRMFRTMKRGPYAEMLRSLEAAGLPRWHGGREGEPAGSEAVGEEHVGDPGVHCRLSMPTADATSRGERRPAPGRPWIVGDPDSWSDFLHRMHVESLDPAESPETRRRLSLLVRYADRESGTSAGARGYDSVTRWDALSQVRVAAEAGLAARGQPKRGIWHTFTYQTPAKAIVSSYVLTPATVAAAWRRLRAAPPALWAALFTFWTLPESREPHVQQAMHEAWIRHFMPPGEPAGWQSVHSFLSTMAWVWLFAPIRAGSVAPPSSGAIPVAVVFPDRRVPRVDSLVEVVALLPDPAHVGLVPNSAHNASK